MKYLPFFSLQLKLPYYASGLCPDFHIVPTVGTQALLRNHRCMLKSFPTGIQILYSAQEQRLPLIPLPNGTELAFKLHLQNPVFSLFADLKNIRELPDFPLYINSDMVGDGAHELSLQSQKAAAKENHNVFALVEIQYDDSWSTPEDPELFQISFPVKEAKWLYYLITDKADDIFKIEDAGESQIAFVVPDNVNSDHITSNLAAQYPEMILWHFLSAEPVVCQQKPRKSLQLILEKDSIQETVMSPLPNPAVNNYSQISVSDNQKEDILFQIIKFVSHQFQTTGG